MKAMICSSLILACAAIGPAHAAEDWVVIPSEAPDVTFSVDKSSLERHGELVRFREKLHYAKPEVRDGVSGRLIAEKRTRRVMNCTAKTQGLIQGATYGENGKFISSIAMDDMKIVMSPIPPNTIAASEWILVCGAAATHVANEAQTSPATMR